MVVVVVVVIVVCGGGEVEGNGMAKFVCFDGSSDGENIIFPLFSVAVFDDDKCVELRWVTGKVDEG